MENEEKKKGIMVITKTEANRKKATLKKLAEEYEIIILSKKKYDQYLKELENQEHEEITLEGEE